MSWLRHQGFVLYEQRNQVEATPVTIPGLIRAGVAAASWAIARHEYFLS
jgi:hypothetical protein